ncbi:MAG: ribonuclease III [Firmicutes bacterium]|nr:ribonuclease III [Bacillota bacterium]
MDNYFTLTLPPAELNALSALALAHMGDAVYELLVRTWLCAHGKLTSRGLHSEAVRYVSAKAQAQAAARIFPLLTEPEIAVFRRGRNAHTHAIPQSADPAQYHAATGLEALFGWLYLSGARARINALFRAAMEGPDNAA